MVQCAVCYLEPLTFLRAVLSHSHFASSLSALSLLYLLFLLSLSLLFSLVSSLSPPPPFLSLMQVNIVIFVLAAKASCGRRQRSFEKSGTM